MLPNTKLILGLLSAWEYPIAKRVTRNVLSAGWYVRNVTLPQEFDNAIEITGVYTCNKRHWYKADKFDIVSLEIKLHGKTIAHYTHPEQEVPSRGDTSFFLRDSDVKDEYVRLAEIFKVLENKA